jgi:DNA-binding response OmpR family regulator
MQISRKVAPQREVYHLTCELLEADNADFAPYERVTIAPSTANFGIEPPIMYVCSEASERNRMRRRILLVDDEVPVLLTLKAVLEISGFDVDTAASAREGVSKLHTREYQMLITDMRMEHDVAGIEVIKAARAANYHPAVALLTAFPVAEEDWQEMGADKLLVKPMHTRILLQQIEDLIASHERKLAALGLPTIAVKPPAKPAAKKKAVVKKAVKRTLTKKLATAKASIKKKPVAKKAIVKKVTKTAAKSKPARRRT